MFRGLFFGILLVTLLVNLVFLFATKDKPPDLSSSSTLQTILSYDYDQRHDSERKLVQRSNNAAYYTDYTPDESNSSNKFKLNDDQNDKSNLELAYQTNKSGIEIADFLNSNRSNEHRSNVFRIGGLHGNLNSKRDTRNESSKDSLEYELNNESIDGGANDATINISSLTQISTSTSQNHRKEELPNANNSNTSKKLFSGKDSSPSNDYIGIDQPKKANLNSSQANEARKHTNLNGQQQVERLMQIKSSQVGPRPQEISAEKRNRVSIRVEYRISEQTNNNNNVIYSLDSKTTQQKAREKPTEYHLNSTIIDGDVDDIGDRNKWLNIRVKSSRSHVFVSVDESIIYESKSSASQQAMQQIDASRQAAYYLTRPAANVISKNNNNGAYATLMDPEPEAGRGIHVIVLNQYNGNVMSRRLYDTYSHNQDKELSLYLNMIQDGRIIIFAIKDEASFSMPLESPARKMLQRLGCTQIMNLRWRDMWACILRKKMSPEPFNPSPTTSQLLFQSSAENHDRKKDGLSYAEGLTKSARFSEWASPVIINARIKLINDPDPNMAKCHKSWQPNVMSDINMMNRDLAHDELERRRHFCSTIEGYGRVCDCFFPSPISFKTRRITSSQIDQVPIIVIAGNRPYYLQRMLRSLLSADGINPEMVTVFIDGFYEEPKLVSQLFNLKAIQHRPEGRRGARISHHYKSSLTRTFELFPNAEFAIIFEEDLDIAQDTLLYFNQTMDLLRKDETLYCVSAWNDQGYQHTVKDPKLLYRIETMPGLGWMLKRDLYKRELEPMWPSTERAHDWDMWIRMDAIRKGRECIIPDISRTYHFGSTGTNINAYFQNLYFSKHAFNLRPLEPDNWESFSNLNVVSPAKVYEKHMEALISNGFVINSRNNNSEAICKLATLNADHTKSVRSSNYSSAIVYIQMIDKRDYRNWLRLANCWKIWDLDARGQHKSTWRLFINGIQTLVVGYPASEYSFLKPVNVKPLNFV